MRIETPPESTSTRGAAPGAPKASGGVGEAAALYASADPRALGVFRIFFALVLFADLARRAEILTLFYSNAGPLSNHYTLYAPQADPQWSLLFSASTPGEARVAFCLIALAYLALLVGYRTRAAQLLALVSLLSLNGRNLFFEDGGVVVLHILAVFTAFLPLGARFSVDAVLRAVRAERPAERPAPAPPAVSFAALALVVEAVCIYAFNALSKGGPTWRHGEAVHWVLWQNRVATPLAAWLRLHEPGFFSPLCTYATYAIEAGIALLVASPLRQARCRAAALALGVLLHGSIALLMNLGPFPGAMVALLLALQHRDAYDALSRRLAARLGPSAGRPALALAYDERRVGARRAAALLSALDPFGALALSPAGDAVGVAPLAVVDGDGLRPDPDGSAALAALPLVRYAAPALRPVMASWLAMPEGPRPAPGPSIAWLARAAVVLRESAACAFLLAVLMQLSVDNRKVPRPLRLAPPKPLSYLILYPRLLQGWRMFAPDAPTDDGVGVVEATTAGGRRFDPFTGREPDLDGALDRPVPHHNLVAEYFFALHFEHNKRYIDEFKRFLEKRHERLGLPADERIVQYKVYWLSQDSPPPGQTQPTNRKRVVLLEGGAPAERRPSTPPPARPAGSAR